MNNRPKDFAAQIYRHSRLLGKANVSWLAFIGSQVDIGHDVVVHARARLDSNVRLRDNSTVGPHAVLSNIELGEGSHIEYGVVVTGYGDGKILIGRESYIGIYNVLDWSENLKIGDFVHVAGPSTGIWTHTSVDQVLAGDPLDNKQRRQRSPVTIENNVYIGGNCTIYPGVTIHHHSVVAPNSAVSEDVPAHTMVGGVPAKVIKRLSQ